MLNVDQSNYFLGIIHLSIFCDIVLYIMYQCSIVFLRYYLINYLLSMYNFV